MLAKNVGISVSVVEISKEMNSARAILQLQKSASEELLSTLQRLTVQRLKFLCKETAVKSSGIKAEIIGRLITSWKKLRCSDGVRRRGRAEYNFLQRCAEYF